MNRFKGLFVLALIVAGIVYLVNACSKDAIPRPTASFYLNDFAGALSGAAELYIVGEGEDLYEDTMELEDGGAQIVVATFLLEEGQTGRRLRPYGDLPQVEDRQERHGHPDPPALRRSRPDARTRRRPDRGAGYHIEGYEFAYDLNDTLDQANLFEPDIESLRNGEADHAGLLHRPRRTVHATPTTPN
ncbi:MAG: hypothetical protein M0C28_19030 [Candidatus Moduliflexus flocculans]|nr:hypothetical protein [Candidatus Moduliflexus flocculans]